ncbi:hypothetical protein RE474_13805 (plasmid) [Methanolobus sediminis]|uniref:Uncharacterized protein n=1 Tax=Methanolobus sediminis TaxID=3072978 RepID=A0AA51UMS0_9EURY|nr:hypothetical protein [Methanolobus sediminis]WMW26483.1 hypothetical protein RE474_13805 [Methanolobus sediminis]
MSREYCSLCCTARQRNIVNYNGAYVCLECMFFNSGLAVKVPGRYYSKVSTEIKMAVTAVRKELPDYCVLDDNGFYFVSDLDYQYFKGMLVELFKKACNRPIL